MKLTIKRADGFFDYFSDYQIYLGDKKLTCPTVKKLK